MPAPDSTLSAARLRSEDLVALRRRAHLYCLDAGRPVAAAELAREVFRRRNAHQGTDQLLVRTLLRGDGRFREDSGRWGLVERTHQDVPLESMRFCVVDIEATGSNPREDRVLEVGVVRVEGLQVTGEYQALVDPQREIPSWITRLTGISPQTVAGARPLDQLAEELEDVLEGGVFVAHNIDFDYPFLRARLRAAGRSPAPWPRLCTLRMARRYLPGLDSYRLDRLAHSCGVPLRRHHRAVEDARAAAGVFLHLVECLRERHGVRTVGQLLQAHPRR